MRPGRQAGEAAGDAAAALHFSISQLAVGPRGHVEGGGTRAGWWHAFTWVDGPMSCVGAVQDGARATAVVGVQPMEPLVGAVGAVDTHASGRSGVRGP